MSNEALNFVGGRFVPARSAARIEVVNPATENPIGVVPDSDEADVDAAVRAAHDAEDGWANTPPPVRAKILRAFAQSLADRGEEIAKLVTAQNGTAIGFTLGSNLRGVPGALRYFADLADALEVETLVAAPDGSTSVVRKEPIGVSALIIPWNGPMGLLSWKLGPALAAGCTVVIKPAPETSLQMQLLAEASIEAGVPDGVLNYVLGGRETGAHLVRHPLVRKIAFTGSSAAGKLIAQTAAAQLKPVTLELGGKSAAILLEDVDLSTFTPLIPTALMPLSGQACFSTTRIIVPSTRLEETVDALAEAMNTIRVGDPLDAETQYGPMSNANQYARVNGYIATGISGGARVVTGGGRPAGLDRGYFVAPTVFTDADNSMRIAQEEIFGPVLVVLPYSDEREAVSIANDSAYGLGGTVFTADHAHGVEVARKVQTGTIGVNRYNIALNAPFGGYKDSGMGRELGQEGLNAYLQTKTMYV